MILAANVAVVTGYPCCIVATAGIKAAVSVAVVAVPASLYHTMTFLPMVWVLQFASLVKCSNDHKSWQFTVCCLMSTFDKNYASLFVNKTLFNLAFASLLQSVNCLFSTCEWAACKSNSVVWPFSLIMRAMPLHDQHERAPCECMPRLLSAFCEQCHKRQMPCQFQL